MGKGDAWERHCRYEGKRDSINEGEGEEGGEMNAGQREEETRMGETVQKRREGKLHPPTKGKEEGKGVCVKATLHITKKRRRQTGETETAYRGNRR